MLPGPGLSLIAQVYIVMINNYLPVVAAVFLLLQLGFLKADLPIK